MGVIKVWGLFFDNILVCHYQNLSDLERDCVELKKNLGEKCPVLSHKIINMGFF
jgi:hypothetical protein